MRSIAFADFLIGLGILFVLEGCCRGNPAWMRGHEERAASRTTFLRVVGIDRRSASDLDMAGPSLEHGRHPGRTLPARTRTRCATAHLSLVLAHIREWRPRICAAKKCCAINVIVSAAPVFRRIHKATIGLNTSRFLLHVRSGDGCCAHAASGALGFKSRPFRPIVPCEYGGKPALATHDDVDRAAFFCGTYAAVAIP